MNIIKQNRLPEFPLANKAKLIISKNIQSQIMYLHSRIGDIEWSGELLYSTVEGSITDIDNLVFKAEAIFPLDKGSAAYTEHETTADIVDIMDMYPAYLDGTLKRGYIHTHHNMTTFFSGTDNSELHDNSPKHNYYLSLIVNHKSQYCAKIAIVAENKKEVVSHNLVLKDAEGQPVDLPLQITKEPEKYLVLIDCIIEFEQDEDFKAKVAEICARPVRTIPTTTPVSNTNSKIGKNVPVVHDSRKFNKESNTNKYADKYSRDVNEELDWHWNNQWSTSINDDLEETIVDEKAIDRFLRKILSTEVIDLEDKKSFPSLIDGIKTIDKSLTIIANYDKYLKEVEQRYQNNIKNFFELKDFDYATEVVMAIGDYVDSLVPMNEIETYDDLYSDISNLMWSQK